MDKVLAQAFGIQYSCFENGVERCTWGHAFKAGKLSLWRVACAVVFHLLLHASSQAMKQLCAERCFAHAWPGE